jgi:hypothetical protein
MTPDDFLTTILDPGLAWCAELAGWNALSDDRARVLLLAIAGQESGWSERIQAGNGPAHGFWQFERGGVTDVLTTATTYKMAMAACAAAQTPANPRKVWQLMATVAGDHLAVALARLLLWSDPAPLPAVGSEQMSWNYYANNWRPGKPRPNDWLGIYRTAVDTVGSGNAKTS